MLFADGGISWPTAFVLAVMLGGLFGLVAWALYLEHKGGRK